MVKFIIEGCYRVQRTGDPIDEAVLWTVIIELGDDGWRYSASAKLDNQEWADDGGPFETREDAIEDAEHRLSGNTGIIYDISGCVVEGQGHG